MNWSEDLDVGRSFEEARCRSHKKLQVTNIGLHTLAIENICNLQFVHLKKFPSIFFLGHFFPPKKHFVAIFEEYVYL
jgi:hypothetical protein